MSSTIRPAADDDYPTFARWFPELRTGDPTPPPDKWGAFTPTTLFLEEEAAPLGMVYYVHYGSVGFIRMLIVDPAARGRGVGQRLMGAAAAALARGGATSWRLNVLPDNHTARRLYDRLGMRAVSTTIVVRTDWEIVDRLPREPGRWRAEPVDPGRAAELESHFDFAPGQLAAIAGRPGNIGRLLRAEGDPSAVGFGSFTPWMPGIYPFAAKRPTVVAPLLEAFAPHRDPSKTYIQLVVENGPEVAGALLAAGARRHLEILHMRGALPT